MFTQYVVVIDMDICRDRKSKLLIDTALINNPW